MCFFTADGIVVVADHYCNTLSLNHETKQASITAADDGGGQWH